MANILTIIPGIFLARILFPIDYGLIATVMIIITILSTVVNLGFGSAIIQDKKIDQLVLSSIFYLNTALGILIMTTIYLSSDIFTLFYQHEDAKIVIKWLSPIILFSSLRVVPNTILTKQLEFSKLAMVNVISTFLASILGLFLAYNGFSYWSLIASNLTQHILHTILVFVFSKWIPTLFFSFQRLKSVWQFASQVFIADFINVIFIKFDSILLSKYFEQKFMGFYTKSLGYYGFLSQYTLGTTMQVLFPVLSAKQNDASGSKYLFNNVFKVLSLLAIVVSSFFHLNSENFIVLILTEKWFFVGYYLKIMVIGMFAHSFNQIAMTQLKALGYSKLFLKINIVSKTIIVCCYIISVQYGINAVVWVFVIGKFLEMIVYASAMELKKLYSWRNIGLIFIKDVIFVLPAFLLCLFFKNYVNSVIFILLSIIIYMTNIILIQLILKRTAITIIINSINKVLLKKKIKNDNVP